jgi:hypothetical protein
MKSVVRRKSLQDKTLTLDFGWANFTRHVANVPDPRRARGRRHALFTVIALACAAILAGIEAVWPEATVQTCIVLLLRNTYRNTYRYASKRDALRRDLKPVYQAVSEADARDAFDLLTENWGERYPTIVKLWDHQWATFTPFLAWDVGIRKLICSTNGSQRCATPLRPPQAQQLHCHHYPCASAQVLQGWLHSRGTR